MPQIGLSRTDMPYREDDVLTDFDVAKMLKVRIETVQEMARNPKYSGLIGRKIKRKWRFHRDAVKNCLLGK